MKIKIYEISAIIITFLAVAFTIGYFVGRDSVDAAVTIETQNSISAPADSEGANTDDSSKSEKININTASAEVLKQLSGIGEIIAQRIIEYREENGMFSSIEEIKNVKGIGDYILETIKDDITV